MYNLLKPFALLSLSLGLMACDGDDDDKKTTTNNPTPEPVTIIDVAEANGNFTTLLAALNATDLDEVLDNPEGTFTVFAPTDDAFALLGEETINSLLQDTEVLKDILLYHVLSGVEVDSAAAVAAAGTTVAMANMDFVGISLSGDNLLVNTAIVTLVDVEADNGVIHVIDTVLIPPVDASESVNNIVETAQAAGSFTKLIAALEAADLDTTLADEEATFTVFAPTDAAFELLGENNLQALLNDRDALRAVLLQHVVPGAAIDAVSAYAANGTSLATAGGAMVNIDIVDKALTVGGVSVTTVDIVTSNGIIHVIDAVILGDVELPSPPLSIVDIAAANTELSSLVSALQATGLDNVLSDLEATYTVFAPTNAAFAALGDALDGLSGEAVSDILLYHVISGSKVLAADAIASAGTTVSVSNGDKIGLSLSGDTLRVNTAAVTTNNIMAANGVIHVIDKVLMPPEDPATPTQTIAEIAVATPDLSTLVTALQTASLVSTLDNEGSTFTVFAPTNSAFAAIGSELLNAILADADTLNALLLQHVVGDAAIDSVTAYAANGTSLITASGANVGVAIVDGQLTIGGAKVMITDVPATNGIVHIIDTVIVGDLTLPTP